MGNEVETGSVDASEKSAVKETRSPEETVRKGGLLRWKTAEHVCVLTGMGQQGRRDWPRRGYIRGPESRRI